MGRHITSVLDVTQGNVAQTLRVVAQSSQKESAELRPEVLEPRLTCALNWVTNYLPEDERTHISSSFNDAAYEQLSPEDRSGIQFLASKLDDAWDLAALTQLVYGIPKMVRGLSLGTPPDDELKQAQRSFFIALYTLICGNDTGATHTDAAALTREREDEDATCARCRGEWQPYSIVVES